MTSLYNIYDQLAEILAHLDPEKIMSMKTSPSEQDRFLQLSSKHRNGMLSSKEKDELDHFIVVERIFRLAKIRADKQTS